MKKQSKNYKHPGSEREKTPYDHLLRAKFYPKHTTFCVSKTKKDFTSDIEQARGIKKISEENKENFTYHNLNDMPAKTITEDYVAAVNQLDIRKKYPNSIIRPCTPNHPEDQKLDINYHIFNKSYERKIHLILGEDVYIADDDFPIRLVAETNKTISNYYTGNFIVTDDM